MALTPAEKSRRFRERQKQNLKAAPDAASDYIAGDFSSFTMSDDEIDVPGHGILDTPGAVAAHVDELLEGLGVQLDWRDLDRAEQALEALTEAAQCIASIVNAFKFVEVEAAIARLKSSDLTDPAARDAALSEAVKLDGIKRRLGKKTRRDFAATVVKGEP